MTPPIPQLQHFCDLSVELGDPIELGDGRAGTRRIIPIVGGSVTGQITGRILSLGADWQTIFANGAANLDTRYAMETDSGAVVEIVNIGTRAGPPEVMAALAKGEAVDPSTYYMRTHARLESGHPDFQHLNALMFVGSGMRQANRVLMALYEVM